MSTALRTPVAMLAFNRPDTTARVLERVRAARPPRLLVVADGPRAGRDGEAQRCAEVRALFDRIDWDCEVERNFADRNMGCRRRVASGLGWVFERTEEVIVLEDDCLPDPTFFPFCEALLARHRDDERVAAITGNNFQEGRRRGDASYYYSRFPHIWGWASWRRAWRHYDVAMRTWPEVRATAWLEETLGSRSAARVWRDIFDMTHSGQIDTWDAQWVYAVWRQRGLTATPNVNLVSNIGWGLDATHTKNSPFLGLPTAPIDLPPSQPGEVAVDDAADRLVQRVVFTPPLLARVGRVVRAALGWETR